MRIVTRVKVQLESTPRKLMFITKDCQGSKYKSFVIAGAMNKFLLEDIYYQYMSGISLFVYGSLMDPSELDSMFPEGYSVSKARVDGFVRDYSKKSHSWGGKGVLGIMKSEDEWCNGLLISDVSEKEFRGYCKRELGCSLEEYFTQETGYDLYKLDRDEVELYTGDDIDQPVYTVVTNFRLVEEDIHAEYRELCESAARLVGEEFYNEFMATTYSYYSGEVGFVSGVSEDMLYSSLEN